MNAAQLEKLLRKGGGNVKLDVRLDSDGTVAIFSEYEDLAVLEQPSLEEAAKALAKVRLEQPSLEEAAKALAEVRRKALAERRRKGYVP